jgi:hypothetical protein
MARSTLKLNDRISISSSAQQLQSDVRKKQEIRKDPEEEFFLMTFICEILSSKKQA